MKEYIEREQAIDLFYPVDPENDGSDGCTIVYKSGNFSSSEIEAMLSDLPTAEVAEVRHGRWIDGVCSECGFDAMYYKGIPAQVYTDYCPSCGARMGEEDEHEAD